MINHEPPINPEDKNTAKTGSIWILIFIGLTAFSWFFFLVLNQDSKDYFQAIDPVDQSYTAIAHKYSFSYYFYIFASLISLVLLQLNGRNQAPLFLIIQLVFLLLGALSASLFIIQYLGEKEAMGFFDGFGSLHGIFHLCITIAILIRIIFIESKISASRNFKNRFLNFINQQIANSSNQLLWVFVLLVPIYFCCTLILILFGQDYNSLSNVFTETTNFTFSTKTHPPILDHSGHYLCTVAACGNPKIVKPLRLGTRHSREIIVNRQLMIANAFENILEKKLPKIHRVIRKIYDQYGYPLSKDITSQFGATLTYILMKPLEWLFLIFIYLFCTKPEELINSQYSFKSIKN